MMNAENWNLCVYTQKHVTLPFCNLTINFHFDNQFMIYVILKHCKP